MSAESWTEAIIAGRIFWLNICTIRPGYPAIPAHGGRGAAGITKNRLEGSVRTIFCFDESQRRDLGFGLKFKAQQETGGGPDLEPLPSLAQKAFGLGG